jgi:hypothetical protein
VKVLCIRPRHNTPGKKDVTGAFAPEADKFLNLHGTGGVETFDNRKPMAARRREVLELLKDGVDFDAIAFFCHGWSNGIQAGFTRANVAQLAKALDKAWEPLGDARVVLYCCSTGADPEDSPVQAAGTGDNSFADRLRDALCALGDTACRVTAHDTVAHTTMNPHALFFDGMGSPVGGAGGYYPVAPGSPLWPKWRKALRTTDMRFEFPFMSIAEIHAELA